MGDDMARLVDALASIRQEAEMAQGEWSVNVDDAPMARSICRTGKMGLCRLCKDPTTSRDKTDMRYWLCSYCQRMMDEPGD